MIQFICGCTMKVETPLTEEVFSTYDSVVIDGEGFMCCLIHHERRKGWRSLPTKGGKVDYRLASLTPLEIERYLFWNEWPMKAPTQLIGFTRMPDLRDNRDPVEIGAEILAKKNGNEELTMITWPERKQHEQIPPPGPARWGSD